MSNYYSSTDIKRLGLVIAQIIPWADEEGSSHSYCRRGELGISTLFFMWRKSIEPFQARETLWLYRSI